MTVVPLAAQEHCKANPNSAMTNTQHANDDSVPNLNAFIGLPIPAQASNTTSSGVVNTPLKPVPASLSGRSVYQSIRTRRSRERQSSPQPKQSSKCHKTNESSPETVSARRPRARAVGLFLSGRGLNSFAYNRISVSSVSHYCPLHCCRPQAFKSDFPRSVRQQD